MRRLLILLSAVVAVDTMFYTALAPLLPHFTERYDLSKTGAGVLFAVYGAGVLAAAIPGGLAASRFGPKLAVLSGMTVTVVATLGFAFASSDLMLSRGAARPGVRQRVLLGGGARLARRGRAARQARSADRHARWARPSSERCSARQ